MMLFVCGYLRFDTEEKEEVWGQISSSTRGSGGQFAKAKLRVLILLPGHLVRNYRHEYLVVCNISHSAQPVPSAS